MVEIAFDRLARQNFNATASNPATVPKATMDAATKINTCGRNERATIASEAALMGGSVIISAPAGPTPIARTPAMDSGQVCGADAMPAAVSVGVARISRLNFDERDFFTITRTGSIANPLTVYYLLGGTASNGADYNMLSSPLVIPAGTQAALDEYMTAVRNSHHSAAAE